MGIHVSVASPTQELEQSAITKAITDLAAKIYLFSRGGHVPNIPKLDVTFMLTTENEHPGFHGMRMGGYTDEDETLYFDVAVPLEMSFSDFASDYVNATLFDVVDNAEEFFSENAVNKFNRSEWQSFVKIVVDESKAPLTSH